mgnify:CR=1 FL=1
MGAGASTQDHVLRTGIQAVLAIFFAEDLGQSEGASARLYPVASPRGAGLVGQVQF